MKAQRRHELQENELARVIKQAPSFWQQSGGKLLAAVLVVLVIVILVRYRITSTREARLQAMEALAQARTEIEQLQSFGLISLSGPPQQVAAQQRQFFNEANASINTALRSDDKTIEAEAIVARGDLHWIAGTLPALPGAATQPALQIRDPKELIATATESYQTVISNYADQPYARIAARFGLAAIHENRGEWDDAKKQYEQLALETKDFPGYQQLASLRLTQLEQLRQPVVLGTPMAEPALVPGTPDASTQPLPPLIAAPAEPATTQIVPTTEPTAPTDATAPTQPAAPVTAPAPATTPTAPQQ